MQFPQSCDTFVVLPPYTKDGVVVFGKNSDRPQNEVQEVVYVKAGDRTPDSQLQCTYINIDVSEGPVNSVILSKPAWMWGAEMGANDKNVVIGNEAVWTNYNDGDGDARQRRLLGMDLVRLGLEQGNTAKDALDVITTLLEKYGQGGPCSEQDDSLIYHNSFLIADPKEAWVLETSGKLWAAEKVEGFRNISNGLTITTKIDKSAKNLKEKAQRLGLWDGKGEFNFTACFSSGGDEARQCSGEKLLKNYTKTKAFDVRDMLRVLRDKNSRICRGCDDPFPTQGSQVSTLRGAGASVHWFTATPDPSVSYFKPFVFTDNACTSPFTVSPNEAGREHELYKLHAKFCSKADTNNMATILHEVEEGCLEEISELIKKTDAGELPRSALDDLMVGCVDTEMKMYG